MAGESQVGPKTFTGPRGLEVAGVGKPIADKKMARNAILPHHGPRLAAPTAPDLTLSFYFQELSSLICAIDCRGSMIESHSPQTPTRIFENVTADRLIRMSRVS